MLLASCCCRLCRLLLTSCCRLLLACCCCRLCRLLLLTSFWLSAGSFRCLRTLLLLTSRCFGLGRLLLRAGCFRRLLLLTSCCLLLLPLSARGIKL